MTNFELLVKITDSLSDLVESTKGVDPTLNKYLFDAWRESIKAYWYLVKKLGIQVSPKIEGLNQDDSRNKIKDKPVCPDHHNCPGWIQGFACDYCDYRPV